MDLKPDRERAGRLIPRAIMLHARRPKCEIGKLLI
jgi:hypothetical protein